MSGTTSRTHLAGLETAPPDIGRRRRPSLRLGSHAFLMLLLAGFLAPVVWALVSAFKPANDIIRSPLTFDPGTVTLDNYVAMFRDVPLEQRLLLPTRVSVAIIDGSEDRAARSGLAEDLPERVRGHGHDHGVGPLDGLLDVGAQVPFTREVGIVACLLHILGPKTSLLPFSLRDVHDAVSGPQKPACIQHLPAGNAHRTAPRPHVVGVRERQAPANQPVQIRRFDLLVAQGSDRLKTLIV
jgi:hypothetical protein